MILSHNLIKAHESGGDFAVSKVINTIELFEDEWVKFQTVVLILVYV